MNTSSIPLKKSRSSILFIAKSSAYSFEFDSFLLLECERNENKEKESGIGPLIERLVYGSVNLAQLLDWLLPKPKNCDYKPQTVNWFSSNIFVLLKFKKNGNR